MAEGIEVAKAIVTIVPSMEGSQAEMTKQLTSASDDAGEKAGKSSGKKFTEKFGSGIKTGAKVIAGAVTAATATLGVMGTAIYSAASATASYGDNIDKMSQKIGMSATAYQEWDFIAQHSGTSMESMKTAMVKLSNAAENGSDAFDALGISAEEARNMNREELWNATILALTGVEDETERTRLAQELFGKGATEMGALLNTSASDIEAMKQQAHDLGIVMSEEDVKASAAFQDSLQNMSQSFAGLKNRMTAEFLPGITTIMDGLTLIFSGDAEGGVAMIKEGIASIADKITEVLPDIIKIGGDILSGIIDAITENLPELIPLAVDLITQLGTALVDHAPELITGAGEIVTQLISGISENLPQILASGGEIIGSLLDGIAEAAPDIITAIGEAIANVVTAISPYIPEITDMVEATTKNLPDIITAFQGIVDEISPIIDSITSLIDQIGDTVVSIVDSVGDNLAKIVTSFSDLNKSLADPIEAIGTAISGIITSISDGVVAINDSVANILEKLQGVFVSIGDAATKAGDGFATVADAAIRLANQTNVFDLIATLAGIAKGIADINREAGWMADHDIANKLEKIGPPLRTVTEDATGLADAVTNISNLAESIKSLNNETKDHQIGTNIETIEDAISDLSTQASTTSDDLNSFVDGAKTDFSDFDTSISETLSSMEETFKGKNYNFKYYMKDAIDNINLLTIDTLVENIRTGLTTIDELFSNVAWTIPHINTPHFYWSGVWDMDGSDGKMSAPSLNVSWYDKGGIFNAPTVIGVGEKRPEFVGALDDLRDIVREESAARDVTINVYGAEGQDVRALADIVMDRIQHTIDRREAVFA